MDLSCPHTNRFCAVQENIDPEFLKNTDRASEVCALRPMALNFFMYNVKTA